MSSAISRPSSSAQRPAEEAALLEGGSALSDELATASEQPALHEQPPRGMLASFNCTVAGVVMLHLYVYLTVVFCVIVPWLSWSVPGLLNLGIFSANTGTALLCFLACVVADPGRCEKFMLSTRVHPHMRDSALILACMLQSPSGLPARPGIAACGTSEAEGEPALHRFPEQNYVSRHVPEPSSLIVAERGGQVLPEVQPAQAAARAPLPGVQALRPAHGPPLPLDQQLRVRALTSRLAQDIHPQHLLCML